MSNATPFPLQLLAAPACSAHDGAMTAPETPASDSPTLVDATAAEGPEPVVLRGIPVAPGLGMGPARIASEDLAEVTHRRVPQEKVQGELERFRLGLEVVEAELRELAGNLGGKVPEDHVRILDTHVSVLRDSVFLSDVENLILREQLALEAAIAKVILDFDRIFKLVENEAIRERAVDLRDVGIRVLRALERESKDAATQAPEPAGPKAGGTPVEGSVLVARELTVVDLMDPTGARPAAIVTESGSPTSHAAVLARSLGIPTLCGVEGLLSQLTEGEFVIVDAAEGVARIRPEARIIEQFKAAGLPGSERAEAPEWMSTAAHTLDGTVPTLTAACGSLPDVQGMRGLGIQGIGMYRTELLYLLDREPPTVDALIAHYRAVLTEAGPVRVTFRLADLSSGLGVPWLSREREPNPALGRAGVRLLLDRPELLRRQLNALLRAADGHPADVGLAVPMVVDCGEFRRIREALFEERYALRRENVPHAADLLLGAVIETPAAVFGAEDLAAEAAFLAIGLDSFQQYILAADRGLPAHGVHFEHLHPYVLRAVAQVVEAAEAAGTPLRVFGITAARPENVGWLLGVGVRDLVVGLAGFENAVRAIRATDIQVARRSAAARLSDVSNDERPPMGV